MERSNFDRDNISQRSQVRKPFHTYTPTSHENLIKSQLKFDAANQAKLHNELRRLGNENDRLKSDLAKAHKDIDDKNKLINILNDELRDKHAPRPKESSIKSYQTSTPYVVDGKPLSLDEINDHFNIILQRHHDLLNHKNNEIRDLKDVLDRSLPKNVQYMRAVETQSSIPNNEDLHQNLMNEFTNQISTIRKEYEQVENILTHRNNKLENLIEELQQKLDQYSKDIERLRKELASRETQPSESTIQLLWEKEKENKHLKERLINLQQMPDKFEIRKIVDDKEDAVIQINEIISAIKNGQPSALELPDVEKECQSIVSDLNKTNDKLNNVIKKLKDSQARTNDKLNKDNLIPKLESLKKQSQGQINVLNRHLKHIDDKPIYLRDVVPDTLKAIPPKIDKSTWTHLSDNLSIMNVSFIPGEQPKELFTNISPLLSTITSSGLIPKSESLHKHKHFPTEPCEACNDADFSMPKWNEPSITVLEPLPSKTSDSKRKLIKDFYPPSPRALSKERKKQHKTKRGCCGKQESEFSNYPYEKRMEGNPNPEYQNYKNPYDEKIVKVHSPQNINENTKNLNNPMIPRYNLNPDKGIKDKPPK